jgi:LmbE family N-acetylglucosaminyl deacetylase
MAVLGVHEHHVLGYPDGTLDRHDQSAIASVVALIDEIDPDTILTFGPEGMTFHPDHIAVHHWVRTAWERRGADARLLLAAVSEEYLDRYRDLFEAWGIYMTDERPVGVPSDRLAVHHRLSGPMLDRKVAALRAMASQTAGIIAELGVEAYAAQNADEYFIEAPRPVDPSYGSMITGSPVRMVPGSRTHA